MAVTRRPASGNLSAASERAKGHNLQLDVNKLICQVEKIKKERKGKGPILNNGFLSTPTSQRHSVFTAPSSKWPPSFGFLPSMGDQNSASSGYGAGRGLTLQLLNAEKYTHATEELWPRTIRLTGSVTQMLPTVSVYPLVSSAS